jgi:hypothetical protein
MQKNACYLLLLALLAGPVFLRADAPDAARNSTSTTQILFEPKTQFPAQGGPAMKAAFLNEGTAFLVGGRGEFLLGESLGLGVASYSLSTELMPTYGANNAKHDLGLSYGGVSIDDSFYPRRLFYFNVSCLVALGQASSANLSANAGRDHVDFLVLEPEVNWMLNVTEELRIGLGFSWRILNSQNVKDVVGVDLGGGAASFTLMYGKI